MKKVTEQTVTAFMNGKKRSVGNTQSTGDALYLHGNIIAKRVDGKVFATNAGWPTPTTRERLNGLPDVWFTQHKGAQIVSLIDKKNDIKTSFDWDGDWIWIGASSKKEAEAVARNLFSD